MRHLKSQAQKNQFLSIIASNAFFNVTFENNLSQVNLVPLNNYIFFPLVTFLPHISVSDVKGQRGHCLINLVFLLSSMMDVPRPTPDLRTSRPTSGHILESDHMYAKLKGVIKPFLMHRTEQNTKTGRIPQW